MDKWGDHTVTCMCNGDRTIRHNRIRDTTYIEACDGALRPEREKSGLLPARPAEDGLGTATASSDARRPADIWFPRGEQGGPEAADFAVTSGLRPDMYRAVIDNPMVVFDQYEAFKRSYKETHQCCQDQGLLFSPMVLEAHGGGWSPAFRRLIDWIVRSSAAANSDSSSSTSLRIAQRISCSLQRENARAVLKRLVPRTSDPMYTWGESASTDTW